MFLKKVIFLTFQIRPYYCPKNLVISCSRLEVAEVSHTFFDYPEKTHPVNPTSKLPSLAPPSGLIHH